MRSVEVKSFTILHFEAMRKQEQIAALLIRAMRKVKAPHKSRLGSFNVG